MNLFIRISYDDEMYIYKLLTFINIYAIEFIKYRLNIDFVFKQVYDYIENKL